MYNDLGSILPLLWAKISRDTGRSGICNDRRTYIGHSRRSQMTKTPKVSLFSLTSTFCLSGECIFGILKSHFQHFELNAMIDDAFEYGSILQIQTLLRDIDQNLGLWTPKTMATTMTMVITTRFYSASSNTKRHHQSMVGLLQILPKRSYQFQRCQSGKQITKETPALSLDLKVDLH